MEDLNLYKPSPSFPNKIGSAFQFKPGFKTDSNEMQTACIFVEAVPQSEERGKDRRSKQSGFIWATKDDNDKFIPHPKKIVFCMDLVDLSALNAFFIESDRQIEAYYVLQGLKGFGVAVGKALSGIGDSEDKSHLDGLRNFVSEVDQILPENKVKLTHQHAPRGSDKEVTKGFEISYPFGYNKDAQVKLTSNEGAGHNVISMFLKPSEVASLRLLAQGTTNRYFFLPKKKRERIAQ